MLKVSQPALDLFQNIKCGEIFCIAAAVFNVSCCLCGSKMHLEEFSRHFQVQHLTLVEQSIDLDVFENKHGVSFACESSSLEQMSVKGNDISDDPIKQELVEVNKNVVNEDGAAASDGAEEDDDDNKCLQELVNEAKYKFNKTKHRGKLKKGRNKKPLRKKATVRSKKAEGNLEEEKVTETSPSKEACVDTAVEAPKEAVTVSKDDVESNEDVKDEEFIDATESLHSGSDLDLDKKPKEELPFPCSGCKRSYRTKESLRRHVYNVHNPNNPARKRTQSKPQHKCEECNEIFSSARNLRGHKWKHTGIFCDICGKTFTQAGNMIRHKIRHTGQKDYKCKECPKEFFTAKELKLHMLCHSKLMPVICEICGKGCRDRGVLTAHMRRHTGERPAKCDVCGKCFFSFHDLNIHAVTHTTERPFKCDICGSTFQRKKALRIHKLIHSQDRKHVCKICGKGFSQSSGLNSHMRSHDAAICTETFSATRMPIPTVKSSAEGSPDTENAVMAMGGAVGEHIIEEFMS